MNRHGPNAATKKSAVYLYRLIQIGVKISRRKRGTVLSARPSRSNEEISRIFESEVQEESGAGNELLSRSPHVVSADKVGELESEIDEVKDTHLKLETC